MQILNKNLQMLIKCEEVHQIKSENLFLLDFNKKKLLFRVAQHSASWAIFYTNKKSHVYLTLVSDA